MLLFDIIETGYKEPNEHKIQYDAVTATIHDMLRDSVTLDACTSDCTQLDDSHTVKPTAGDAYNTPKSPTRLSFPETCKSADQATKARPDYRSKKLLYIPVCCNTRTNWYAMTSVELVS